VDRFRWTVLGVALLVTTVVVVGLTLIVNPGASPAPPSSLAGGYTGIVPAGALLRVSVSGIYPGGAPAGLNPEMPNPLAGDPDGVERGMKDFDSFNCSGCHGANAGGAMGPSLSNDRWIYRASPANIYLSIVQGRAAGMPAFGAMLPDRTVWELVAYIQSISQNPGPEFGTTTSAAPQSPSIEQVPAEQVHTATPWQYTEPMPPQGQKPG
jgi:cytochrome c oxidase cbb3-type subunit 3